MPANITCDDVGGGIRLQARLFEAKFDGKNWQSNEREFSSVHGEKPGVPAPEFVYECLTRGGTLSWPKRLIVLFASPGVHIDGMKDRLIGPIVPFKIRAEKDATLSGVFFYEIT